MPGNKLAVGGRKAVRAERGEKAKALIAEKLKAKKLRAEQRRKIREECGLEACPIQQPRTIENTREFDETFVQPDDPEDILEENTDEFASYFQLASRPKVLLTTSPKAKLLSWKLCYQLQRCIPEAKMISRKSVPLKKLITCAKNESFTDLLIVHEDNRQPNGIVLCHLPDGPTAYFKLQSLKFPSDIKGCKRDRVFGNPELVLNNFSTRLGHTIARMFACLFPQNPHFRGRRVVTFHCQRDYIFFRHHW
ncbi:Brix domain containing protein [Trichuris trichiura]|uniref:Brix domain containing protein n=1 Tax=Trichuris trichiura TaxID=36087 RepID=A0A077ZG64_TRITR|nr:Brix domain containing protein [Trichuris trichiura]